MTKVAGFALCVASLAFAQESEKLAALRYPDPARWARIEGEVRVIHDGVWRVLSGHPVFAATAIENAKILGAAAESAELVLHFKLVSASIEPIKRKEPRGDAFDRLILRLFHQPTFRVVDDTTCVQSRDLPPNSADFTKNPVEVRIYGRGVCLQTQTAY